MSFPDLEQALTDERCGLFFLAGIDHGAGAARTVLTIHSSEGVLDAEQRRYIESLASILTSEIAVRFQEHSAEDLYQPESLERFAQKFGHDRILADPTGAFARVSEILGLARLIRTELGAEVSHLFWQPRKSVLFVVAQGEANDPEVAGRRIDALLGAHFGEEVRRLIRRIEVTSEMPKGRVTPIDAGSHVARPAPASRRFARALGMISGLAALIGLGTVAAAQGKTPEAGSDADPMMPGISALVDLTTLGETTYGLRNDYRALGGLRLYFRESGTMAYSPFLTLGSGHRIASVPENISPNTQDNRVDEVSEPIRVAYGT